MVNLENIYSPCQSCAIRGHSYFSENTSCQRCEYNIAIQALKKILRIYDHCKCCQNREYCTSDYGGYYDCKLDDNDDFVCEIEQDFIIDWKAVFKEYGS